MIIYCGEKLTEETKGLLSNDLTGHRITLRVESDDLLKEHADFYLSGTPNYQELWWRTAQGEKPTISFDLVRRIEWGDFSDSTYEAIVFNGSSQCVQGWAIVVIDERDRNSERTSGRANIRAFGFSTLDLPNSAIFDGSVIHMEINEHGGLTRLRYLQAAFDLFPGAALHNETKRRQKIYGEQVERLAELDYLAWDLRELRLSNQGRYSEVTYWREYDTRKAARRLRKELYGDICTFMFVDDFWVDYLQPQLLNSNITIPQGIEVFLKRQRLAKLSDLQPGDFFFAVSVFEDTYSVRAKFWDSPEKRRNKFDDEAKTIEMSKFLLREGKFDDLECGTCY